MPPATPNDPFFGWTKVQWEKQRLQTVRRQNIVFRLSFASAMLSVFYTILIVLAIIWNLCGFVVECSAHSLHTKIGVGIVLLLTGGIRLKLGVEKVLNSFHLLAIDLVRVCHVTGREIRGASIRILVAVVELCTLMAMGAMSKMNEEDLRTWIGCNGVVVIANLVLIGADYFVAQKLMKRLQKCVGMQQKNPELNKQHTSKY